MLRYQLNHAFRGDAGGGEEGSAAPGSQGLGGYRADAHAGERRGRGDAGIQQKVHPAGAGEEEVVRLLQPGPEGGRVRAVGPEGIEGDVLHREALRQAAVQLPGA